MSASDFKLIRPITVASGMITSSSVPETVAATYSAGTTYAAGALVGLAPVTGQAQVIWKSLQAGNLGNALAEGAWWTGVGSVYPAYNVGTAYVIGDYAQDNTNHVIYRKLTNGTGDALSDVTKWERVGPTNKWALFDATYQTQTQAPNQIEYTLEPATLVTSIALLNVDAASVTVEESTSGFSETISLVSHVVRSWWEYFTEVPIRTGDVVISSLPPKAAPVITVTFDNSGGTAKCGVLILGKAKFLGFTQWEANRSIIDYSKAIEAADGTVSLTQGNYSKRLNVEFRVPSGYESEATRILEQFRATPLVFVGSEAYSMTIIYGFLGSWAVPVTLTNRMAYAEIKGLV